MQTFGTVIISLTPYVIILIGLVITVATDTYIKKPGKRLMVAVLMLTISLVVQGAADSFLNSAGQKGMLRRMVGSCGYIVRPVIIALFYTILNEGRKTLVPWILTGVNGLVFVYNIFSGIAFTYSPENGQFVRGPLGYTCHIISAVMLALLLLLIVRLFRRDWKRMILPF